jgi:hypothetical protein
VTEVWFVGVKTAGSLIHRAISLWREPLPVPCEVRGVDIEPGSSGARYVELLEELRTAPGRVAGAVVSVGEAARLAPRPIVARAGDSPWDELIAAAPPGSLIVNATGLGKDRPGSPITERARFPEGAVVWELNYRGELHFLDRARAQIAEAGLKVHDGWRLFCHGWAAALGAVLELDDDPELGERFAAAAAAIRPG